MNEDVPTMPYLRHEKIGNAGEKMKETADNDSYKSTLPEDGKINLDKAKVQMLQERMHEMRKSLMNDVESRLNDMMSEVTQRLRVHAPTQNGFPTEHTEINNTRRRNGKLAEKEFASRNSYLTDLLEINHFRTIYNIFIVMLIIMFLNNAMHDFLETGSMHVGIKTIQTAFGKFSTAVQIWMLMLMSTFATYLGFSAWAHLRADYSSKAKSTKLVDYGFLLAFIAHQTYFIFWPAKRVLEEQLAPASSMMVIMEQIRMLMKVHAFVRSNAPKILNQKAKVEDHQESNCPGFSKFLYFMFIPTLVYRDVYPRTKQIRWSVALWNIAEIVMIVFYTAFIFERFILPPFDKLGLHIFEPRNVILYTLNITLPSLIMFCFGFYCILHSSQNAMAELLRFGDKLFYKDWWNCNSYVEYYRTWNIIVHDWLHAYIYKDVYERFNSRLSAMLATFLISAIFHEYILILTFRFFYPVMFVLFAGFGLLLFIIMKNYPMIKGNIFIWLSLFLGTGIIFALYSMEFHARNHCPPYESAFFDLVLPRSWTCYYNIAPIESR